MMQAVKLCGHLCLWTRQAVDHLLYAAHVLRARLPSRIVPFVLLRYSLCLPLLLALATCIGRIILCMSSVVTIVPRQMAGFLPNKLRQLVVNACFLLPVTEWIVQ